MRQLRLIKSAGFKYWYAALITIVSMVILGRALTQAHENTAGTLVGATARPNAAPQVLINDFSYSPVPLTVKVGTTVTWINHDDIPHAVDSTQGKFKSGALDTDDKFEFRFTQPGEFPFYCRIHPKMMGKIIVQP